MFSEPRPPIIVSEKAIRDPDFAGRLKQICDEHPHAPDLHYGRLGWIRQQLGERFNQAVSTETVRRWLAGESVPRREKMRQLASLFEVNIAWLSLGVGSARLKDKASSFVDDIGTDATPNNQQSKGENWLDRLRQELAGTVTIPPGVDITEPTGEIWDAEL